MDQTLRLLELYLPLIGWVGFGWFLGRVLPARIPAALGKFLFWIGVPIGIFAFLRQANLSETVWLAPLVAWIAMLSAVGLAWVWIRVQNHLLRRIRLSKRSPFWAKYLVSEQLQQRSTQGSFLLAAMVGNTGYLGYPVSLSLVGHEYFGWAVFYDTLGSTLGAYGFGVLLAAYFSDQSQKSNQSPVRQIGQALLNNPALWSFWIGLAGRSILLPQPIELGLKGFAWSVIALSLLLLGMRLSQLASWSQIQPAIVSLSIKMLIIPLLLGFALPHLGISDLPQLTLVLQMAMPPAFATLFIAEAYDLDRSLTVTTLLLGSIGLLIVLPFWLWLFAA
ncbi:AEC family transporter [Leptolyngbya ohadii]|uniref:AEC family transporter n=1 Tax=Leptolyngbya ohadii TaxID=1962290 RepID=UPI000B59E06E|nr:AEC family transporter [Leptolyngbya ohadii]